ESPRVPESCQGEVLAEAGRDDPSASRRWDGLWGRDLLKRPPLSGERLESPARNASPTGGDPQYLAIFAASLSEWAPWHEHAPGGKRRHIRHMSGDVWKSSRRCLQPRYAREQTLRVGVQRPPEEILHRRLLSQASAVQHAHRVAHLRNDTQVVRDK